MFIELDQFPQLQNMVKHVDILAVEFENQYKKTSLLHEFLTSKPGQFVPTHIEYWTRENGIYPDQIGYTAEDVALVAFPIFKKGFPIKWYDPQTAFPKLYSEMNLFLS